MMRNINMPSFPSLMVQRYNKIEKQRDFKAPQALSGDTELTARAANVLNSVAKVQHNFETTKNLAKKNCLLSYHSALIAGASVKAAQTILAPRPFHQEDQPTVMPGRGTASLNQKEGSPADIPQG